MSKDGKADIHMVMDILKRYTIGWVAVTVSDSAGKMAY
tara:strand:+ start:763 stop:876 length:114 start_codon:yes stop_codon:yes gene_type:complete